MISWGSYNGRKAGLDDLQINSGKIQRTLASQRAKGVLDPFVINLWLEQVILPLGFRSKWLCYGGC